MLPTPSDRTRRVVYYDADCGFCEAACEWLAKRDRHGVLAFLANDDASLPTSLPPGTTADTVVVVDRATGAAWTRGRAVAAAIEAAAWGRVLAALMRLPIASWLVDCAYALVATRRHRISAALGLRACRIRDAAGNQRDTAAKPSPNEARFP